MGRSTHEGRPGRIIAVVVALLVAFAGLRSDAAWAAKGGNPGPNEGSFEPGSGADDHCITPSGVDLNERYGVDERIIASFCKDARTGEFWTTTAAWIMEQTFESVPEGFESEGDTPLEDFLAKFVGIKYVVDPGTRQERTYLYSNTDQLAIIDVDGLVFVNTLTMGKLHPLRAGHHTVDTFWLFDAQHCDGLGDVEAENCLPAGEVHFHHIAFDVASPDAQG